MLGMTFDEARGLREIPPLTKEETIHFYETGRLPQRYADTDDVRRERILSRFIDKSIGGQI